MRFLKDVRGLETVEWLAAAAVVVTIALATFAYLANSAKTQGNNTKGYIDSIPTPDAASLGGS